VNHSKGGKGKESDIPESPITEGSLIPGGGPHLSGQEQNGLGGGVNGGGGNWVLGTEQEWRERREHLRRLAGLPASMIKGWDSRQVLKSINQLEMISISFATCKKLQFPQQQNSCKRSIFKTGFYFSQCRPCVLSYTNGIIEHFCFVLAILLEKSRVRHAHCSFSRHLYGGGDSPGLTLRVVSSNTQPRAMRIGAKT
jgi:hypothetical protein